MSRTFLF